jgi:DNA-directed RNA polymerase subunit RPC12/RpoP
MFPASGRGYAYVCPHCGATMTLHDLRDGDQAYWCHACDRGHRAGDPPAEALRPIPEAV